MYCNYIENTNLKIDFKWNFTIKALTLNYSIHIKYMVSGKNQLDLQEINYAIWAFYFRQDIFMRVSTYLNHFGYK